MIFWKCFFDLFDPSSKNCFKQGKVTFAELEWGEYSVEEVKAPEGYRMNLQIFEFVINGENLTEEISVKNEPIDWEIPKTRSEERRVGKECRYRWEADGYKRKHGRWTKMR